MNPIRIGYGYDTHRLVENRKLILGGVEIPHAKGLLGHSDADVLLHAICDALLGALNLRDIGFHFPDTDPQYHQADSRIFVRDTFKLLQDRGYELGNLDCTIIAEKPKINPHIPAMQTVIAELLQAEEDQISIKATTHEKTDATGREESMVAQCVALVVKRGFWN
ncbi:2-C-methyl-D-erythritol 2,4-cyclodiphosphate synthase [Pontibacter sp. G13]|uniref:2-C-methyl-D-erythritol 2,4-cyclodiphosphate synthase n=1 Tax=Pontibacter sp. G13 TaxID=3074898 RepID=UPI00288A07CD|nr:2-C-methyl-D-erythritol 2,4-cyclodiphosphate synthase [Pontibacter sp. G13]WNJ15948.1 2-C-methyl-D-erythritol 2,4-cyclodiphosphate synthase [Pontibacter sp. G13]